MKLIEAIKHKENPYWIPDCTRDDFIDFFKELGFKTGAEIGVSLGINLETYCKAGFKMYGIDPWEDYDDEHYRPINALSKKGIVTKTFDDVYEIAIDRLLKYANCDIIRRKSMDALDYIHDRSLDFVYIDSNHKYGYVAMDLMQWAKKVKKGGIIAGHDYHDIKGSRQNRGVKHAVDGFMKSFDIENFWVLGSKDPKKGEKTERALSYFCFKHW